MDHNAKAPNATAGFRAVYCCGLLTRLFLRRCLLSLVIPGSLICEDGAMLPQPQLALV